ATHILQAACREAVDNERDIAPTLKQLGHARIVGADTATAVEDRHRRQMLPAGWAIELCGYLDGLAARIGNRDADGLLGEGRRGKKGKNEQPSAHCLALTPRTRGRATWPARSGGRSVRPRCGPQEPPDLRWGEPSRSSAHPGCRPSTRPWAGRRRIRRHSR